VGCLAWATLATGIAVATTTRTSPITLCVGKGGALTLPTGGSCNSRQTAIQVASAADVQALATRMDGVEGAQSTDESTINSLQSRVSSLQTQLTALQHLTIVATVLDPATGNYRVQVTGQGLEPTTAVSFHYTDTFSSGCPCDRTWPIAYFPNPDGSYSEQFNLLCTYATNVYAEAQVQGPAPEAWVDSNFIPKPPC
jgi:hypothetical protein